MVLGAWLEIWITDYIGASELQPSTKAMYKRSVNAVPAQLAAIELEQLKPYQVLHWLRDVQRQSPRAAQLDRVMMNRAITVAAANGLTSIIINQESVPRIVHKPRKAAVLTADQLQRYAASAQRQPEGVLLILCLCGLRRGQVLGLRWSDFDQSTGTISINQQRQRAGGEYIAKSLKSASSRRRLRLPEPVARMISNQPRSISGYICDTTPERLHRAHKRTLQQAGIEQRVTLHGLRHTYATQAAAAGVPIKVLQGILGHATYALTADLYCNHLPETISVDGFAVTI